MEASLYPPPDELMMTRKPSAPYSLGRIALPGGAFVSRSRSLLGRGSDPALDSLLPLVHPDLPEPPPLDAPGFGFEEFAARDRRKSWLIGGLLAVCLVTTGTLAALFVAAGDSPPSARSLSVVDVDPVKDESAESVSSRAARGDQAAIREIEIKESWARAPEEVVALSAVRVAVRRDEVADLGQQLKGMDPRDVTRKDVDRMLAAAADALTYQQALLSMAEIPNYVGPDLLFRVTRDYRTQAEVLTLAKQLLKTAAVSERASTALSIALEADAVESCDEARALLTRAERDADRRAVLPLARFADRTGCGEHETEDCFRCLRVDRLLVSALRAAQGRIEPQF